MSRFEYSVIITSITNKGGRGVFPSLPKNITIHHSAVAKGNNYNAIARANSYSNYKGGYMPYHIFIPADDSNLIYITQYLNQYTWHNSNGYGNLASIACVVDGNFEIEQPSEIQLAKLKQLCDDIADNYFSNNGWFAFDKYINPKDNKTYNTYAGKTVLPLHWHNEIAEAGHGTSCCGKNLMPYVSEYRNKQGDVKWGVKEEPPAPVDWRSEAEDLGEVVSMVAISAVPLVEIDTGRVIKTFEVGSKIGVRFLYKNFYITEYSYEHNIKNGLPFQMLVKPTPQQPDPEPEPPIVEPTPEPTPEPEPPIIPTPTDPKDDEDDKPPVPEPTDPQKPSQTLWELIIDFVVKILKAIGLMK